MADEEDQEEFLAVEEPDSDTANRTIASELVQEGSKTWSKSASATLGSIVSAGKSSSEVSGPAESKSETEKSMTESQSTKRSRETSEETSRSYEVIGRTPEVSLAGKQSSLDRLGEKQVQRSKPGKWQRQCSRQFRDMIGKREMKNEELERQQGDLRQRLNMLECSMPAVMVWNIWRMTQGGKAPCLQQVLEKQFQGPAAGEACCPISPSRHFDCRVRETEAERKQAQKRVEEARALWAEKMASLEDREKRLQEARRLQEEQQRRIDQLTIEVQKLREARNADDDGACEAGECGVIECKKKWLEKVPSSASIRSTDIECLEKLHELAEAELCMKRQIADLERREEAYMRTLQQADELWTCLEADETKETTANQQMADRIAELEDELQRLRSKMAACRGELEKYMSIGKIEALIGRDDDFADVDDMETAAVVDSKDGTTPGQEDMDDELQKLSSMISTDEEVQKMSSMVGTDEMQKLSSKVGRDDDFATVAESADLARVSSKDAAERYEEVHLTDSTVDDAQRLLAQLGSLSELDDPGEICGPNFDCNDLELSPSGLPEEERIALEEDRVTARELLEMYGLVEIAERMTTGETTGYRMAAKPELRRTQEKESESLLEQTVIREIVYDEEAAEKDRGQEDDGGEKEDSIASKKDSVPSKKESVSSEKAGDVLVPMEQLSSWQGRVHAVRLAIAECPSCSTVDRDAMIVADELAAYTGRTLELQLKERIAEEKEPFERDEDMIDFDEEEYARKAAPEFVETDAKEVERRESVDEVEDERKIKAEPEESVVDVSVAEEVEEKVSEDYRRAETPVSKDIVTDRAKSEEVLEKTVSRETRRELDEDKFLRKEEFVEEEKSSRKEVVAEEDALETERKGRVVEEDEVKAVKKEEIVEEDEVKTVKKEKAVEEAEVKAVKKEEIFEEDEVKTVKKEKAVEEAEVKAVKKEEIFEEDEVKALKKEEIVEEDEAKAVKKEKAVEEDEAKAVKKKGVAEEDEVEVVKTEEIVEEDEVKAVKKEQIEETEKEEILQEEEEMLVKSEKVPEVKSKEELPSVKKEAEELSEPETEPEEREPKPAIIEKSEEEGEELPPKGEPEIKVEKQEEKAEPEEAETEEEEAEEVAVERLEDFEMAIEVDVIPVEEESEAEGKEQAPSEIVLPQEEVKPEDGVIPVKIEVEEVPVEEMAEVKPEDIVPEEEEIKVDVIPKEEPVRPEEEEVSEIPLEEAEEEIEAEAVEMDKIELEVQVLEDAKVTQVDVEIELAPVDVLKEEVSEEPEEIDISIEEECVCDGVYGIEYPTVEYLFPPVAEGDHQVGEEESVCQCMAEDYPPADEEDCDDCQCSTEGAPAEEEASGDCQCTGPLQGQEDPQSAARAAPAEKEDSDVCKCTSKTPSEEKTPSLSKEDSGVCKCTSKAPSPKQGDSGVSNILAQASSVKKESSDVCRCTSNAPSPKQGDSGVSNILAQPSSMKKESSDVCRCTSKAPSPKQGDSGVSNILAQASSVKKESSDVCRCTSKTPSPKKGDSGVSNMVAQPCPTSMKKESSGVCKCTSRVSSPKQGDSGVSNIVAQPSPPPVKETSGVCRCMLEVPVKEEASGVSSRASQPPTQVASLKVEVTQTSITRFESQKTSIQAVTQTVADVGLQAEPSPKQLRHHQPPKSTGTVISADAEILERLTRWKKSQETSGGAAVVATSQTEKSNFLRILQNLKATGAYAKQDPEKELRSIHYGKRSDDIEGLCNCCLCGKTAQNTSGGQKAPLETVQEARPAGVPVQCPKSPEGSLQGPQASSVIRLLQALPLLGKPAPGVDQGVQHECLYQESKTQRCQRSPRSQGSYSTEPKQVQTTRDQEVSVSRPSLKGLTCYKPKQTGQATMATVKVQKFGKRKSPSEKTCSLKSQPQPTPVEAEDKPEEHKAEDENSMDCVCSSVGNASGIRKVRCACGDPD